MIYNYHNSSVKYLTPSQVLSNSVRLTSYCALLKLMELSFDKAKHKTGLANRRLPEQDQLKLANLVCRIRPIGSRSSSAIGHLNRSPWVLYQTWLNSERQNIKKITCIILNVWPDAFSPSCRDIFIWADICFLNSWTCSKNLNKGKRRHKPKNISNIKGMITK